MIIYYRIMRYKDEQKQDAIIQATIQLVNEIGFAASSVSKIAKQANVSPATLYIYYTNKEDLLVSTYVSIKILTRRCPSGTVYEKCGFIRSTTYPGIRRNFSSRNSLRIPPTANW